MVVSCNVWAIFIMCSHNFVMCGCARLCKTFNVGMGLLCLIFSHVYLFKILLHYHWVTLDGFCKLIGPLSQIFRLQVHVSCWVSPLDFPFHQLVMATACHRTSTCQWSFLVCLTFLALFLITPGIFSSNPLVHINHFVLKKQWRKKNIMI